LGALIAFFLSRNLNKKTIWIYADLLWVAAGGLAVIAAVSSNSQLSLVGNLQRQVDALHARSNSLSDDVKLFEITFCDRISDVRSLNYLLAERSLLCDHLKAIHESISPTSQMIELLNLLGSGNPNSRSISSISFDISLFDQVFMSSYQSKWNHSLNNQRPLTQEFEEALASLSQEFHFPNFWNDTDFSFDPTVPLDELKINDLQQNFETMSSYLTSIEVSGVYGGFSPNFRAINDRFLNLIADLSMVQNHWSGVSEKNMQLLIRLFATCTILFLFPIRIGKSIFEIRRYKAPNLK